MRGRAATLNDRGCKGARRTDGVALLVLLSLVTSGGGAHAQGAGSGSADQFGGQSRADAISLMTVLAVQQAISSLPPTSGQSLVYGFSYEEEGWVFSPRLGPTIFRSPQTIGPHTLSLRLGVSYFELGQTFGPINYLVQFDRPSAGDRVGVIGLGARADVDATVMNLSASYGLTSWLELMFNLPLTVIQATASQISSTTVSSKRLSAIDAVVNGPFQSSPLPSDPAARAKAIRDLRSDFRTFIRPSCQFGGDICLDYRGDSFKALGFDFNEGTHAGVGRISLGGKASLYTSRWIELAFMTEFFAPSPSEAEFAGSDSASILPRGVAAVPATDWLRFYADVGYDYDFDQSALRRLTWTAGASVPLAQAALDLGVSGSEYDTPVRWTPSVARGMASTVPGSTITALENNQLGDNFIDFIGGLKLRVAEQWILSLAISVPVNGEGFRPTALGTLALEYYVPGT